MEQRVAIVTGGLRGLGRAMALGLAQAGYQVAAVGHIEADIPELTEAAAQRQLRDRIFPLVADLRDAEECDRIVAETRARFGSVGILVNNAGLTFTYISTRPASAARRRSVSGRSVTRSSTMSSRRTTSPATACRDGSRRRWWRKAGAASSTSQPSSTR